jgi:VIT1/CCC1 family predicted Fe2+/Mn2+ transporter
MSSSHPERHFRGSETLRDVVLGMSDGLTVPFALAAGLSGAVGATHLVVTAGLAEIAAGSLAMGLGGYLAARSASEHYQSERLREQMEVREKAQVERAEVIAIFKEYGMTPEESHNLADALERRPEAFVDFMMRFELGLERPEPERAVRSAVAIALSYVLGGLVPLLPYVLLSSPHTALALSCAVTLSALFVFGYVKGRFTGAPPLQSAVQTLAVGGLAAAAAFGLARLVA